MTHAYDERILHRARRNFGLMLDLAVVELGLDLNTFYELFLKSSIAPAFASGSTYVITGASGYELAFWVLEESKCSVERFQPDPVYDYSPEFWAGWAVSYYQWQSSKTFQEINEKVPITEVLRMYDPYHEMDILHFRDEMDSRVNSPLP